MTLEQKEKFKEYVQRVKNGEFSMNRAYRYAQAAGFNDSFAQWIDMSIKEGWSNNDGSVTTETIVTNEQNQTSKKLLYTFLIFATIGILYYGLKNKE